MTDDKTSGQLDLKQRLHLFSSPAAEAMDEGQRINEMCKVSWEAIDRIEELEARIRTLEDKVRDMNSRMDWMDVRIDEKANIR